MQIKTFTKGYSLVEVLVAVAILMLSIIGPMTIAVKSLQSAQYAKQQNTAFFLAQEGISIINTLRNNGGLAFYSSGTDSWAWTSSLSACYKATGCNIDFIDSSLLNNVVDCSTSADTCMLRFSDPTSGRAAYRNSGGEITPFKRIITLRNISADEVQVTSEVQWDTQLLGGGQSVTLGTSLFNLYK
jgi:Tfp pilus assembly protein PilV